MKVLETKEIEKGLLLVEESKGYPLLPDVISSDDSYSLIGTWAVKAKERIKIIKEYFEPRKQAAKKVHTDWCDAEKETLAPYRDYLDKANLLLNNYILEQERLRKAEEARLREEALKREEEERLQAAIETGDESILDEPAFVPPPIVKSSIPHIAGLTSKTTWIFRVVDGKKVPREYLMPDEIKIGRVVRALKEKTNIPGIEVYKETSMKGARK